MSKRNSGTPSNTLFKYFTKTPPANKKTKSVDSETNGSPVLDSPVNNEKQVKHEIKKRERQSPSPSREDSDEEVLVAPKRRKRIRLNPVDSDDSDVENKADNELKETPSLEKKLNDSFKYDPNKTPKSKENKKETEKKEKDNKRQSKIPKPSEEEPLASEDGNWVHCKLEWLKPHKIKDAKKRRPDHPDYDPSTLYVPPEFFNDQTPAHRQWWEMKSSHYDCVLFFKVGKFYELYHMDAAVGVNELGFSYMKGEFAHSGFPESAYGRMASTLVAKGYKVARVEQTETPDMMQERCKRTGKSSKWDKVVSREICGVSVRGATALGPMDAVQHNTSDNHYACYLLAVDDEEINGRITYGVCFIDTTIGQFHLGQFEDDKHSSRLLTTLAHYPPALITYDRKTTSQRTRRLLRTHCHDARQEPSQFWSPDHTLKTLAEKYYRSDNDGDWPDGIKPFLHEGDALGLTPAANCSLAIKALGGCVSYLTRCLLDIQTLGMRQFTSYTPPDVLNQTLSQEVKAESRWEGSSTMVLDSITLRNLRIVNDEGCLYDRMNYCSTAFGKRLLYQWVCTPSCNLSVIRERQEAVRALYGDTVLCQDSQAILTALPDLERLLTKVHALGNLKRSKDHPDARAIFYEEKIYSKRKVLDFISVLNGFTEALKLGDLFDGCESTLLKRITQFSPEGKFPDYRESLKFFKNSFNQAEAEKEGRILPGAGVDLEYDNSLQTIREIEQELQEYVKEQEQYFKCRVSLVGSDKKRYQLEVTETAARKAGADYTLVGARKGYKRFTTEESRDFLARMMAAEEQKRNVLKDLSRRIFEKFSSTYERWEAAVQCVAVLDVLLAFAEFARQLTGDVCLPDVTFDADKKPYLDVVEGRHPCLRVTSGDVIPNSARVEGTLLLTGPNMGGKSTLMRQLALLTVLAHIGSYVPAEKCSVSLCDRVFTRLGAHDDILSGESTFYTEMSETNAVLRHSTVHSLVLIDELGRGTSTFDGAALAHAVCLSLAARGGRGVFSTHYHGMVGGLRGAEGITLGHMACMVETEDCDDSSEPSTETITFLYKLTEGACPKSYGFNAAKLAGIPPAITRRGRARAEEMAREAGRARALRGVARGGAGEVRELLKALVI